jgi:serine/threonine protein kinase
MGEVYRARDSRLERDIALKVLPAGLSLDAQRLQRFEQEARAVATLNHPNILAVHDVGRHLEKSPGLRFQSAQDLAFALENAATPSSAASGSLLSLAPRPAWAARLLPLLVALAAGAAIGAAVVARLAPRGGGAGSVVLGRTIAVTRESGLELHPTLSPDGALVAYAAGPSDQMHSYVRQVAGGRAIDLTPTLERSFGHPRWSHDGTRILFAGSTGAYVVPALGGVARRVLERARLGHLGADPADLRVQMRVVIAHEQRNAARV